MKYNNTISYQPLKIENPNEKNYFIRGICTCGGRHYSENMCYEDALAAMPKYVGVVEHFGGGVVELVEDEDKVLKYKIIH